MGLSINRRVGLNCFFFRRETEESVKEKCLKELLTAWKDPSENTSESSAVSLAIEGASFIRWYLNWKYPPSSHQRINWPEYHDTCTEIRLWLLTRLMEAGHAQYVDDPFGHTMHMWCDCGRTVICVCAHLVATDSATPLSYLRVR